MTVSSFITTKFHATVVKSYNNPNNSKQYYIGDSVYVIDVLGDKYLIESDIIDIIPRKNIRKVKRNGKKKVIIKRL